MVKKPEVNTMISFLVQQYSRMFARNLIYTALTRAKEKLILLGEPEAYAKCIQTLALNRKTTLTTRLITRVLLGCGLHRGRTLVLHITVLVSTHKIRRSLSCFLK